MKKNNLLLLVLTAGLLVTGCARETSSQSSVDSSSISSTVVDNSSNSSIEDKGNSATSSQGTSNNSASSQGTSNSSASSEVVSESEGPATFTDQTAYTAADKALIATIDAGVAEALPFMKNYEYYCEESMYYYDDIEIGFDTTSEEYQKLLAALRTLYGTPDEYVDEDNDTTYTFIVSGDEHKGVAIDCIGYVYQGSFYVYVDVYLYDDSYDDDDDDDEDGILLNADSIGDALTAKGATPYAKKNFDITYGGVTYEVGGSFGISVADPYTYKQLGDCFQLKGGVDDAYIKNKTELPAFKEITIAIASTYAADKVNLPTVKGGNSATTLTNTATAVITESETTDYKSNNYSVNMHYVTYTFAEEQTFFKLANTQSKGAMYVYGILIGTGSNAPTGERNIPADTDGTGVKAIDLTAAKDVKNVTDLGDYIGGCPTTGNVKGLVIPVDFSDYDASTKGYTVEKLNKIFNGTGSDTDYYSVSEYYKTASGNKLNLSFDIYDSWFRASKSFAEYSTMYANESGYPKDIYGYSGANSSCTPEQIILDEALAYLDAQGVDLSQYDSDNNGTIDNVVLVYSAPADYEGDNELAWAWRYWNAYASATGDYKKYDNVYANDYLWVSYEFMFETGENDGTLVKTNVNTYTFIHEFGHILGADDYYDTSYATDPMKGVDVMNGVYRADQNAYTKMHLGWITSSKLITTRTNVTVDLQAFEGSNDTIIIANNWDDEKGAYQSYWVLTYYTNTGLNAGDDNGLFDKEGLVIYQVHSDIYYDEEYESWYIEQNNTSSGQYATPYNLIDFVYTSDGGMVFEVGSNVTVAKDDNNLEMPYTIEVISAADGKLTLKFTANFTEEAETPAEQA